MNAPDNRFKEFEEFDEFSNIDTNNLITEFLKKPKLVYKFIFKTNPEIYFWPLLIIAGAANGLEKGLERVVELDGSGIGLLIGMLLGGGALGWISYFIAAWFLYLFGAAFLNGKATAKDFRVVIAWSNIPSMATVIVYVLMYVLYGFEVNGFMPNLSNTEYYTIMGLNLVSIGLILWSLALNIIGIMHIQKFGMGKALANILLPTFILFAILWFFFRTLWGI